MFKSRLMALAAPLGLGVVLAGCGQMTQSPVQQNPVANTFHADLNPLNANVQGGKAAHGGATVTLEGNTLTVTVEADGLVPNMPHPQHIHGLSGSLIPNAVCPPEAAAPADGDPNTISLADGLPYYGGIEIPLVKGTLESGNMNFPVASAEGQINFSETYTLTPEQVEKITPLYKHAIVLHGAMVNGEYVPTLPVACGTIELGSVQQ